MKLDKELELALWRNEAQELNSMEFESSVAWVWKTLPGFRVEFPSNDQTLVGHVQQLYHLPAAILVESPLMLLNVQLDVSGQSI